MKQEAETEKMENTKTFSEEELTIKTIKHLTIKRIQLEGELCEVREALDYLEQSYRKMLRIKADKMSGMKGVK